MPRFVTAITSFLVSMAAADSQVLQQTSVDYEGAVNLSNWINLATLKSVGAYVETSSSTTFKIKGNKTTGYEWKFDENDAHDYFDVETSYVADSRTDEQEDWTGIGGMFYFRLNAGATIPNAEEKIFFTIWEGRS